MKKLFLICGFALVATPALAALTADEVVQKQFDANKGYLSESAAGKMSIFNEAGSQVDREFTIMQMEEQGADSYKAMIKVNAPADLKGTGLLTSQNKGGEDDQWLYLPAMKKTRRISGEARGGKFLGSNFNFEDLSPKEKDDYTYVTLRVEPCDATNCHVIEAKPKAADSLYSKTVGWIREDNFMPVKTEMYDKDQALQKVVTFADYQLFAEKYWRALKITMQDVQKKTRTELLFSNQKVNAGLTAADFSKQALER